MFREGVRRSALPSCFSSFLLLVCTPCCFSFLLSTLFCCRRHRSISRASPTKIQRKMGLTAGSAVSPQRWRADTLPCTSGYVTERDRRRWCHRPPSPRSIPTICMTMCLCVYIYMCVIANERARWHRDIDGVHLTMPLAPDLFMYLSVSSLTSAGLSFLPFNADDATYS